MRKNGQVLASSLKKGRLGAEETQAPPCDEKVTLAILLFITSL